MKISLKFVPKVQINNIPALVQIMAQHQPGGKTLSEPMMATLPVHLCITLPQWINQWAVIYFSNTIVTIIDLLALTPIIE